MEHESVKKLWEKFLNTKEKSIEKSNSKYTSWYFDNNEKDANELAELVVKGIKRATASLVISYEYEGEELPNVGDYSIITNWEGIAQCIIQTKKVEIVPYKDVTAQFAATEGEGDKSLAYWRKAHWNYFSSEIRNAGKEPSEDMLVICEEFEVVFRD